jgi:hypothetical protein
MECFLFVHLPNGNYVFERWSQSTPEGGPSNRFLILMVTSEGRITTASFEW